MMDCEDWMHLVISLNDEVNINIIMLVYPNTKIGGSYLMFNILLKLCII